MFHGGTWHHWHYCIAKRFQIFADVADVIAVPTTHRKSGKPDNKSCPIGFIFFGLPHQRDIMG